MKLGQKSVKNLVALMTPKSHSKINWPLVPLASVIQLLGITIMTFYKIVFYKSRPHIIQNDKKTKLLFVIYVFYLVSKAFISGHFNRCKSFKTFKMQNQYLVFTVIDQMVQDRPSKLERESIEEVFKKGMRLYI